MRIDCDDFRVREGKSVTLKKWPTEVKPYYKTEKELKKTLQQRVEELSDLQTVL